MPAAVLVAALAIVARPIRIAGPFGFTVVASAQQPGSAQTQEPAAGKDGAGEQQPPTSGWAATIAKAVNFAVLVAILVYFLKTPLLTYLNDRISKVREDLVTAARTRETAARQLAEIDAKLKALPMDLEALTQRGAEDIAAERARIEQAAAMERDRLLEQARREIGTRLRVARRELLEATAERAVSVARDRIEHAITPADQARLVDRYAAQLRPEATGEERGARREGARREGAGS